MADNLVFEESVQSSIESNEFISKKWVYVNDNNNGNYTSQTVIDTTPLANSGGYVGWAEGYIIMPLVVQLSGGGVTAGANQYQPLRSLALKNGFWQLLHSMTVEFNNQSVVQQTAFMNVFRSFKALTSFSQDDVLNHGSEIGFYPDNMGAWNFCEGAGTNATTESCFSGRGLHNNDLQVDLTIDEMNNQPNPSAGQFSSYGYNEGLYNRNNWVSYHPVDPTIAGTGSVPKESQGYINPLSVMKSTLRSACEVATGVATWKIYAKLRLKDLHDFFEKMPLLKGSTIRIYLNTNQALVKFNLSANGVLLTSQPSINGGSTCPLMVCGRINGTQALPNGDYIGSVSIVRNTFSDQSAIAQSADLTSCRLYAPIYKFTPIKEQQYLSMLPTKSVKYNDIFQYQFDNIEADAPFNFLVSNGISNIKSVLVVPFLAPKSNICIGTGTTSASGLATILSPFASSGGTPDPITITNFNIMISGVNLFLNNEQYDWEAFAHELAQSNQLNGNQTTSLTSGLISQDQFNRGFRYYYGNCARILPAEAGVSRSVQVVGTNVSKKAIALMVFVEYEREIQIDLTTGARIS